MTVLCNRCIFSRIHLDTIDVEISIASLENHRNWKLKFRGVGRIQNILLSVGFSGFSGCFSLFCTSSICLFNLSITSWPTWWLTETNQSTELFRPNSVAAKSQKVNQQYNQRRLWINFKSVGFSKSPISTELRRPTDLHRPSEHSKRIQPNRISRIITFLKCLKVSRKSVVSANILLWVTTTVVSSF